MFTFPKSDFTKTESIDFRQIIEDKSGIILTVDNGVTMAVMERQDYTQKAKHLLEQPAYQPIPSAPGNKYKTRLINIL